MKKVYCRGRKGFQILTVFLFFFSKIRRQNIFPVQEIKRSRTDDFSPGTFNMIYSNSEHRKGTSQPGRQLRITSVK